MNTLPAIVFCGPPHAGKSVLLRRITQALHKMNVPHHAIRACPDGEGNWSQDADETTVQQIRIKGDWTDEFTERVCQDIKKRQLPMLIDVGGKPQGLQLDIFQYCTHALLLLHRHDTQSITFWQTLVERNGLLSLAHLYSELDGVSTVTATVPTIEGTITGLQRHVMSANPVIDLLVEHIAALFRSYSLDELERTHLLRAPIEPVHLQAYLQLIAPGAKEWEPMMLPRLLTTLPQHTSLSAYGRAPHWLYGALAAFVAPLPFYQFDPRLGNNTTDESGKTTESGGWITPPSLIIGPAILDDIEPIILPTMTDSDPATILTVKLKKKHLDYLQAEGLAFPALPVSSGVILDGQMPSWLLTALVRLYQTQGHPWLACHYPQLRGAIVVATHTEAHNVGDVLPMSAR